MFISYIFFSVRESKKKKKKSVEKNYLIRTYVSKKKKRKEKENTLTRYHAQKLIKG